MMVVRMALTLRLWVMVGPADQGRHADAGCVLGERIGPSVFFMTIMQFITIMPLMTVMLLIYNYHLLQMIMLIITIMPLMTMMLLVTIMLLMITCYI